LVTSRHGKVIVAAVTARDSIMMRHAAANAWRDRKLGSESSHRVRGQRRIASKPRTAVARLRAQPSRTLFSLGCLVP